MLMTWFCRVRFDHRAVDVLIDLTVHVAYMHKFAFNLSGICLGLFISLGLVSANIVLVLFIFVLSASCIHVNRFITASIMKILFHTIIFYIMKIKLT